ncbi:putative spermidine/putrescine transport system substrate-binding protein [Dongia mobilis]|uniref:Putative spermidine/putrescine transport system substrate-binding protein n=1 Tax=Dongia mobilis TaxID=578943 RepID=A0A4R6WU28_9PROT|nr:ABC transporter substrate-binding protein [Dongia mobilis]TDQ83889.1 putative spermidine/putrescine transport system substrate-binding protein [Dongia mobilis]
MKSRIVTAAALALIAATASAQAEESMTAVGWGGSWNEAYDKGVFQPFTAESGIKVNLDEWGGEIAKLRTQIESNAIVYDFVSVEAPALEIGCAEGLFEKLPDAVYAEKDSYLPGTIHPCGMASDTWATVMVYDGAKLKDGPKSWADFWDVEKIPGKRGMLGQAQYTLENALMADGVAPGEVYDVLRSEGGVDRAFAALDRIKPHVVWWTSSTNALQNLSAGEVVMTDLYNARVTAENEKGSNYVIVWEAGFFYGTDMWAIVKGAPNRDNAVKFVEFFAKPENQAGFPKLYAYGVGHKDVEKHLTAEQLERLPTSAKNLPYAAVYDTDYWAENKEALEQRFQAWLAQ